MNKWNEFNEALKGGVNRLRYQEKLIKMHIN